MLSENSAKYRYFSRAPPITLHNYLLRIISKINRLNSNNDFRVRSYLQHRKASMIAFNCWTLTSRESLLPSIRCMTHETVESGHD